MFFQVGLAAVHLNGRIADSQAVTFHTGARDEYDGIL